MSIFYYIAASLPFLASSDQSPPLRSSDLLELCERMLKPVDYEDLLSGNLNPEGTGSRGLSRRFRMWDRSLRNELAILRGVESGRDISSYLRETNTESDTRRIAGEAMSKSNPLEAEMYLNNQRWLKIDELVCCHSFDMEFLRGYRLKLLLLERQEMFDMERGSENFHSIHERVLRASEGSQE